MKVSTGTAVRSGVFAVGLSVLVFLVLVQYAPDSVAFSPNNYGWNGLQEVASAYRVNFTTSLSSVPSNSILVLTAPSMNYTASQAASIRSFMGRGGTVLLASNSIYADSLLVDLGGGLRMGVGYTINDSTYNWKSSSVPTALALPQTNPRYRFMANVAGIALNEPVPLVIINSSAVILASTSQFSRSSFPEAPRGPYAVMAAETFGSGTLIVISDSQILSNSQWTLADNKALIGNLFGNTQVFIDASHWGLSSTAQLKSELRVGYLLLSSSPMRYVVTVLLVAATIALIPGLGSGGATTAFNEPRKGDGD